METLTKETLDQLQNEIDAALKSTDAQSSLMGIDSDFLCENKEAILAFVKMIADLVPGVLGKILGRILIKAAEMWFERHC